MAVLYAAPQEVQNFFIDLYGVSPEQALVGRNIAYSVGNKEVSLMVDSYGGCHVDIGQISEDRRASIRQAIENLGQELKQTKICDSLWVNFDLPQSLRAIGATLPESFAIGSTGSSDLIYDYQKNKARVWLWLSPEKECTIPLAATHNIGATALFCDMDAKKVLVVVNQRRNKDWNLPGGSFDRSRDKTPADTAFHEMEEEGGLKLDRAKVTDERLIGQMQFPGNQFASAINQIWLFVMNGASSMALNPPPSEIKLAEWADFDVILQAQGKLNGYALGPEIQSSLRAAIHGLGAIQVENKGWKITHIPVPNGQ